VPIVEGVHDSEHLLVVDSVIALCFVQLASVVAYWLRPLALVLHEHCSDSKVRGVGTKYEGQVIARMDEAWGGVELSLEFLEGYCVPFRIPFPRRGVAHKLVEWRGCMTVPFYELAVVVA
jgi:hypothetical protein